MSDRHVCAICGEQFNRLDRDEVPHNEKARTSFNAHWRLTWHMEDQHPEAFFVCPRAGEGGFAHRGGSAYWRADNTCSYCGSLHPDKFFEAVESGAEVGPTDKGYKAYLDLPNPDVGQPKIYASTNAKECPGEGWVELTPELREQFNTTIPVGNWVKPEPARATINAKFYFQHLSAEQRARFIDLVNSKRMKLGYPGYFYALPYFCRSVSAQDAA